MIKLKRKVTLIHFGVEESVDIDIDNLTDKYRQIQLILHPDKCLTNMKKRIASEKLHAFTDMYNILKDNDSRIEYLMSLHGIKYSETESNIELLEEVMEYREEYNNLSNSDEIQKFCNKIEHLYKSCYDGMKVMFKEGHFSDMKLQSVRLRYLSKLLKDI